MADDDDTPLLELELPEGVLSADKAMEVLRAWVADGALHVVFDPETFRDDASEWGRLLSDVVHHIAHAVELDGQMSRSDALKIIERAFSENLHTNQLGMSGRIKGRTEH
ncbi:MAG: DUF5076 domain-containing protein [Hyphomicrobiaceae bacterium]|nr:DUF5076 domain-containing protein [Hyphomicrobiaceae bacterium]